MTIGNSIHTKLPFLKYRIFKGLYQKGKPSFLNMFFFFKACTTRGNQDEKHEVILHCYYQSQKKQNSLVKKPEDDLTSQTSSSYATLTEQSKIFTIMVTGKKQMGRTHIQTLLFELTSTNFICKSAMISIEHQLSVLLHFHLSLTRQ